MPKSFNKFARYFISLNYKYMIYICNIQNQISLYDFKNDIRFINKTEEPFDPVLATQIKPRTRNQRKSEFSRVSGGC